MKSVKIVLLALPLCTFAVPLVHAQENTMSFFVTSVGSGKGGDLGGLKGADAHCAKLAEAAGSGDSSIELTLSFFALLVK